MNGSSRAPLYFPPFMYSLLPVLCLLSVIFFCFLSLCWTRSCHLGSGTFLLLVAGSVVPSALSLRISVWRAAIVKFVCSNRLSARRRCSSGEENLPINCLRPSRRNSCYRCAAAFSHFVSSPAGLVKNAVLIRRYLVPQRVATIVFFGVFDWALTMAVVILIPFAKVG